LRHSFTSARSSTFTSFQKMPEWCELVAKQEIAYLWLTFGSLCHNKCNRYGSKVKDKDQKPGKLRKSGKIKKVSLAEACHVATLKRFYPTKDAENIHLRQAKRFGKESKAAKRKPARWVESTPIVYYPDFLCLLVNHQLSADHNSFDVAGIVFGALVGVDLNRLLNHSV
jgi:hypothetical protein